MESEYIGVDLDGTLAYYDEWKGEEHIGAPIPAMVNRVQQWIREGKAVKIFTARAASKTAIPYIKKWLQDIGLPDLDITNEKDQRMIELYDDRARQVEQNTGRLVTEAVGDDLISALSDDLSSTG